MWLHNDTECIIQNVLVNAGNIKRDRIQHFKQELAEQGYTLDKTTISEQLYEQELTLC